MHTIERELRVAFSPRAQPWWFRLVKWGLILSLTARYRRRRWFRYAVGVAATAGLTLHLFYRWKTQGWTRAWGGWSDLQAVNEGSAVAEAR